MFTCEFDFVFSQTFEAVPEGGEDALHGAEHGAETQVEQHEEEDGRPEGASRQQRHGLCEGNESQARPFHALDRKQVLKRDFLSKYRKNDER